jgi:hypothetical protein
MKKDRKAGAGRKVRNIELENYVVSNLEDGFKAGKYPTRKSTIMLAKLWKKLYGTAKYDNFKVSKGWCDKFMKRNKVQLKKWEASLDRIKYGLPPMDSPNSLKEEEVYEEESIVGSPNHFPDATGHLERFEHATDAVAPNMQQAIDQVLRMKGRLGQRPARELVQEVADMYCRILEDPIECLHVKEQICDTELIGAKPRSMSVNAMDEEDVQHRNADAKSDLGQQVNRDLKTCVERTARERGNFVEAMDATDDDQLISFVAEVCKNIESLADKYLRQRGGTKCQLG